MLSYTHFTLSERKYLQELLSEGYSMRKAAAFLDRSPSSVCREINRNKAKYKPHRPVDNKYWYNSWRAQNLYTIRRRTNKSHRLIPNTAEWNYIIFGLSNYWTPEQIAFRWRLDYPKCDGFWCFYHLQSH